MSLLRNVGRRKLPTRDGRIVADERIAPEREAAA